MAGFRVLLGHPADRESRVLTDLAGLGTGPALDKLASGAGAWPLAHRGSCESLSRSPR